MKRRTRDGKGEPPGDRVSKKDQILTLYKAGITEVNDLAAITQSRPSYVAGVLEGADRRRRATSICTRPRRSR